MPTNDKLSDQEQFNLKHRITGAAVLIFFGALVLPWLLGPPSEAKKVSKEEVATELPEKPIRSTFEDEVLAQLQGQGGATPGYEEPEETVYISKITPFNGRSVVSDPEPFKESAETSSSAGNGAPDDVTSLSSASENSIEYSAVKADSKAVAKSAEPKKVPAQQAESDLKDSGEKEKTAAKTTKENEVDVGWIVQVELLTDKSGAERLVTKLKDNGFQPKTTIVDTNKGKATGTRIWVGPFENRSDANSKNQQLESKMGKRGFIRVYP